MELKLEFEEDFKIFIKRRTANKDKDCQEFIHIGHLTIRTKGPDWSIYSEAALMNSDSTRCTCRLKSISKTSDEEAE